MAIASGTDHIHVFSTPVYIGNKIAVNVVQVGILDGAKVS